jgi:hypothetical protein
MPWRDSVYADTPLSSFKSFSLGGADPAHYISLEYTTDKIDN